MIWLLGLYVTGFVLFGVVNRHHRFMVAAAWPVAFMLGFAIFVVLAWDLATSAGERLSDPTAG